MDSEDDMHDANDTDVYDSEGYAMEEDDEDEEDYGFVENASDDDSEEPNSISRRPQMNYTILSEEDIRERQEEAIVGVSTVLSISKVEAGILLRHFKWSVSKVNDEWFADEDKVRMDVGLLEKPVAVVRPDLKELTCGICFETYFRDRMKAAVCGHYFCDGCWIGRVYYVGGPATFGSGDQDRITRDHIRRLYFLQATFINDGPRCLTLQCPDSSCGAVVGEDMVLSLVSDEDRMKYTRYLLRSYVEDNRKTKWCPAPGCEYGVDFVLGSGCYDITCKCSYNFCWNCSEEAHRPVDCETVEKWILKNSAESENMNWNLLVVVRNANAIALHNLQIEKLSDKQCQPVSQLKFVTDAWLQMKSTL